MASLAPHVSRVAKDYAPHGWSYVNEVTFKEAGAFAADTSVSLLLADDSDYYVEAATVAYGAKASTDSSNYYLLSLRYGDNDGSLTNSKAVTSDAKRVNTHTATALQFSSLLADKAPLVPNGKVLYLLIDEQGSGASVTGLTVSVRYRRKA